MFIVCYGKLTGHHRCYLILYSMTPYLANLHLFVCSTNVVMNYTEVEAKVREATSDDAWGPHGTLMHEIAQYTFTYEHFPEVMGMLWKRMLHENRKNWRRVYKVRSSVISVNVFL